MIKDGNQMQKDKLRYDIEKLKTEVDDLKSKIEELEGNTEVTCHKCKDTFMIKDLTYIQTHWYEEPWGCAGGGATWWMEEGRFKCPNCGFINRMLDFHGHDQKKLASLKYRFGGVENTY